MDANNSFSAMKQMCSLEKHLETLKNEVPATARHINLVGKIYSNLIKLQNTFNASLLSMVVKNNSEKYTKEERQILQIVKHLLTKCEPLSLLACDSTELANVKCIVDIWKIQIEQIAQAKKTQRKSETDNPEVFKRRRVVEKNVDESLLPLSLCLPEDLLILICSHIGLSAFNLMATSKAYYGLYEGWIEKHAFFTGVRIVNQAMKCLQPLIKQLPLEYLHFDGKNLTRRHWLHDGSIFPNNSCQVNIPLPFLETHLMLLNEMKEIAYQELQEDDPEQISTLQEYISSLSSFKSQHPKEASPLIEEFLSCILQTDVSKLELTEPFYLLLSTLAKKLTPEQQDRGSEGEFSVKALALYSFVRYISDEKLTPIAWQELNQACDLSTLPSKNSLSNKLMRLAVKKQAEHPMIPLELIKYGGDEDIDWFINPEYGIVGHWLKPDLALAIAHFCREPSERLTAATGILDCQELTLEQIKTLLDLANHIFQTYDSVLSEYCTFLSSLIHRFHVVLQSSDVDDKKRLQMQQNIYESLMHAGESNANLFEIEELGKFLKILVTNNCPQAFALAAAITKCPYSSEISIKENLIEQLLSIDQNNIHYLIQLASNDEGQWDLQRILTIFAKFNPELATDFTLQHCSSVQSHIDIFTTILQTLDTPDKLKHPLTEKISTYFTHCVNEKLLDYYARISDICREFARFNPPLAISMALTRENAGDRNALLIRIIAKNKLYFEEMFNSGALHKLVPQTEEELQSQAYEDFNVQLYIIFDRANAEKFILDQTNQLFELPPHVQEIVWKSFVQHYLLIIKMGGNPRPLLARFQHFANLLPDESLLKIQIISWLIEQGADLMAIGKTQG